MKKGTKFAKLVGKLKHKKGIYNPKALAAWIGRKKYGVEGFERKEIAGRRTK